jgi:hypothetical protein
MRSDSVLIVGPSGTGKSTFAYKALKALGSGIVVMAPGVDEQNSYVDLLDNPAYKFAGFDDLDWAPSIGQKSATGLNEMLKFLDDERLRVSKLPVEERPKVIVVDTQSGVGRLAFNNTLAKFNMTEAPPVRGEQGYPFFTRLLQLQEAQMRKVRAFRAMGLHMIVLSHSSEKENVSEAAVAERGAKMIMPAVPGSFNSVLPGYFDLVMYSQISKDSQGKPVYQLQWRGDMKRPSKSRIGALGNQSHVANDWLTVQKMLAEAVEKREGT